MPGTGPGGQLPGAGARAAQRPKRPRRASRSSPAWPWKAIAARAHAMTAARASPRGEPHGARQGQSRPAVRSPSAAVASWRRSPAPQPAPHGRRRDAQLRAEPGAAGAVQGRRRGGPRDHPGAVGPARGHPGRQQHMSRPAGPAPAPGRSGHGALAAVQPHGPLAAAAPRAEAAAAARRAPERARDEVRPRGLRVGAQQHGAVLSWSRSDGQPRPAHTARGSSCCTIPARPPPRNPNARPARGATVSAGARRRPRPGGQRPGMLRVSSHARHRHVEGDSHRQRRQGPISRSKRTAANTRTAREVARWGYHSRCVKESHRVIICWAGTPADSGGEQR